MTPPLAVRRVSIPALVVSALASLALSGCGGDTKTNGVEMLPARTAQQKALAALRSAGSAHVKGTTLAAGNRAEVDVQVSGRSSRGVIAADGVRVAFTRIEDVTYIKASRRALAKLGAPARMQRIAARRWVKLAPDQVTLSGFSLAEFAAQLAENESPLDPHVARDTLDGKPVAVITEQNGSKLYIANTGTAYPLHGDYKGEAPARLDFTDFGVDVRITAPRHPLDAGDLADRE
jgi:hypothetical protein